ncbi:MAG: HD domain-containing phosphohydrolase [Candidatus Stygibacter australis]|nr:HD domain-containing phosphohydrolase [Candidatus Stygibacter australis]MDP8320787.1 HD domain-containing phosphohydrolase [Candidatus Stygibacter australis]
MSNFIAEKIRKRNLDLIKKLIKIGKSLSLENDIQKVFKIILDEVMEVTNADRGMIYITSPDQKALQYERVKCISDQMEMDSETASKRWKSIVLFDITGDPIMNSLATFVFHTGFEAHFDDVYNQDYFQIDQIITMDERDKYRSKSMVAVPLVDHEDHVLGIIELTNSIDEEGNIVAFSDEHTEILLSVSSQAAITLSNKLLINNLEKMIFDFTQAIAYAIDMKSDKSYQHVQKVALLTNILAKEINLVDDGVYSKHKFSQDELDEIAISGWLHDLGKIVTSNNLLNKNTKLQSSCDRIKFVQTKFELLEQVIFNQLMQLKTETEKTELQHILEKLPEYMDLIISLNQGSEYVSEEVLETLAEIAAVKISAHGKEYRLLDEDELENLMIRRGTLTIKEYDEIKKHADITYKILSNITFPTKFQNVPKIASSHHERLNGTGYPLGLKDDDIPLQSRILAIADVFDALMSERSYKSSYDLDKSLKILASMAKNNEIDKDLMDIMLDKKIFITFASEYDVKDFANIDIDKIKEIYRR